MSGWAARRFWTNTQVVTEEGGWSVLLDGRSVRTPAKRSLVLPTPAMAAAVAEEWRAQGDVIDPLSMPVTRAANAAIDKVSARREEVVDLLAAYAETDLLCYRAESPTELTLRQAHGWDPLLDWAEERFGARLVPVAGVMPEAQDVRALARLRAPVADMGPFSLTAFHDLVMLSGSLVLGLAVFEGRLGPEEAWDLSRIDEEWQAELWGRDAEAEEAAGVKRAAFVAAHRFELLRRTPPET